MISADQPLVGKRILVTRAPHQASELADRLRALGAEIILIPTIEIGPPKSFAALDTALAQLATFDVIAFTSANAVSAFAERARHLGIGPKPKRIAAVGPSTAKAVEALGLRADIIPPVYTAESLGETLRPEASGRNVFVVLAEAAPTTLHDALVAAGARVTVAAAYSNRIPAVSLSAIHELFGNESHWPDAITFTSASTARNLTALVERAGAAVPHAVVRASIGPITTRALAELGLGPQVEAREGTIASLVDALAAHFSAHG
ncbi:MAG TPA: uroporphyrinogen-III synthase [Acidobacteriaceae bacterium]|nr:uroporphyrinogen-III synthase [Acidobacteriaceae bacterium]